MDPISPWVRLIFGGFTLTAENKVIPTKYSLFSMAKAYFRRFYHGDPISPWVRLIFGGFTLAAKNYSAKDYFCQPLIFVGLYIFGGFFSHQKFSLLFSAAFLATKKTSRVVNFGGFSKTTEIS